MAERPLQTAREVPRERTCGAVCCSAVPSGLLVAKNDCFLCILPNFMFGFLRIISSENGQSRDCYEGAAGILTPFGIFATRLTQTVKFLP